MHGQAVNQWIDLMDQSLFGKARAAAKRRQKKWRLSPDEWETLAMLCAVLRVCCMSILLHLEVKRHNMI